MRKLAPILASLLVLSLVIGSIGCGSGTEPTRTSVNPALHVSLDYVGATYDHNPSGPGQIFLILLVDDGIQRKAMSIPLDGDTPMAISDYGTVPISEPYRNVFDSGSVGYYFSMVILAYHRIQQGPSYGSIIEQLAYYFFGSGEVGADFGSLIDQINSQAPQYDYVGSYYARWNNSNSWGVGQYNAVGDDDLRLWFRIWSDSPQQPVPLPTLCGNGDQVVVFPDLSLEAVVRETIGKPSGDIYFSDLEDLARLDADSRGITDLSGLEYCRNLTQLWMGYNQIEDLTPLSSLKDLSILYLVGNKINDLNPLSNLNVLTELYLWQNEISDISPLSNLSNLTHLNLRSNDVSDVSPLAGLTSITELNLGTNQIDVITPLSNLSNLTDLTLYQNQISDLNPLSNLTGLLTLSLQVNQISDISSLSYLHNLTELRLRENQIHDISPISNLTNLEWLDLSENQIGNISPLVENIGLSNGDTTDLRGNPLDTTSENVYIPQLEQRGINLGWTTAPAGIPTPTASPSPTLIPTPHPPPCRFWGRVQINGFDAPAGILVEAVIEGDTYTTTTEHDSTYALIIGSSGLQYEQGTEVIFIIVSSPADQVGKWKAGANIELNLSVGSNK